MKRLIKLQQKQLDAQAKAIEELKLQVAAISDATAPSTNSAQATKLERVVVMS
ncbi:MAG: hypothetical protein JSU72_13775 [Deltaproteobacteria bacterium]|nr:MAG: hypothetical protein JSU72_13775 [Deltaproteobacteria bacterium]